VFSNAFTGEFIQLARMDSTSRPLGLVSYFMVGGQNFISASEYCFRGCKDGPSAPALCQHIYDVMGCFWNMPGNYDPGFDQCAGDSGEVNSVTPRTLSFRFIDERLLGYFVADGCV